MELVDSAGKVVATAMSDFDGFFLFERVAYGTYTVRISAETAAAAKLMPILNASVSVSEDRPVFRLGTISATPMPRIASSE